MTSTSSQDNTRGQIFPPSSNNQDTDKIHETILQNSEPQVTKTDLWERENICLLSPTLQERRMLMEISRVMKKTARERRKESNEEGLYQVFTSALISTYHGGNPPTWGRERSKEPNTHGRTGVSPVLTSQTGKPPK